MKRELIPVTLSVLTVSDTRGEAEDKSGKLLAARVADAGHRVHEKAICRDDVYAIRAIVSRWIADAEVQVVLTTGGTGVTGRDGTPEADRRIARVLWNDPGTGVMRHADAGYDIAKACAHEHGLRLPMAR